MVFDAFGGHKEGASSLPSHVVCLASSASCPVQAFRVGNNVYATQFHPELDIDGIFMRIDVYKNHGYFAPETAESLKSDARQQNIEYPPAILRRFIERYARRLTHPIQSGRLSGHAAGSSTSRRVRPALARCHFRPLAGAPRERCPHVPARYSSGRLRRRDDVCGAGAVRDGPDRRWATSLPLPYFGTFLETNIRLYSIDDAGRHGVLFRSLETARLAVVPVIRIGLGVPYTWAKMRMNRSGDQISYDSVRRWPRRGLRAGSRSPWATSSNRRRSRFGSPRDGVRTPARRAGHGGYRTSTSRGRCARRRSSSSTTTCSTPAACHPRANAYALCSPPGCEPVSAALP